jgi:hypothetical protein
MNTKLKNRKTRTTGSSAIEVSLVAVLTVIFAILGFNMFMVVWGFSSLDSAARDAARAAASTNSQPSGYQAASQAALTHTTDGYFVSQPTVANTANDFQYINTPPPNVSPYVVVTTRCNVRVPVALNFFGAQMNNGLLAYARTYTFPILGAPFTPTSPPVATGPGPGGSTGLPPPPNVAPPLTAPGATSTVPVATTGGPVVSSTASAAHSAAPAATTTAPAAHSAAPAAHSAAPAAHTAAPAATTTAPAAHTAAPAATTTAPAAHAAAPAATTTAPAATTTAPAAHAAAPAATTTAPAATTTAPAPTTTAPAAHSAAPAATSVAPAASVPGNAAANNVVAPPPAPPE